jgi:hypothetical protein
MHAGTKALRQWTLKLLRDETPEFPSMRVAISLMMLLSPAEVHDGLTVRLALLIASTDTFGRVACERGRDAASRLFVLDEDYRRALLDAQIVWLTALLADPASGEITWSAE